MSSDSNGSDVLRRRRFCAKTLGFLLFHRSTSCIEKPEWLKPVALCGPLWKTTNRDAPD